MELLKKSFGNCRSSHGAKRPSTQLLPTSVRVCPRQGPQLPSKDPQQTQRLFSSKLPISHSQVSETIFLLHPRASCVSARFRGTTTSPTTSPTDPSCRGPLQNPDFVHTIQCCGRRSTTAVSRRDARVSGGRRLREEQKCHGRIRKPTSRSRRMWVHSITHPPTHRGFTRSILAARVCPRLPRRQACRSLC